MAGSLLGVDGIILACLGIGLGLVCTAWATRNQEDRRVPKAMMVAGLFFVGISLYFSIYLHLR